MTDYVTLDVQHYRGGVWLNHISLQHDFARPPMDSYMVAMSAGQDDHFVSIRTEDQARFDWVLDWQLGNHCCYVNCQPYTITNTNPAGRVPVGQVPVYRQGKSYRKIVPLWDANMAAPEGNYWIPGIGYGWKPWRVSLTKNGTDKAFLSFKGFSLVESERKRTYQNGKVMGVDLTTLSYLLNVSDEQGRWVLSQAVDLQAGVPA